MMKNKGGRSLVTITLIIAVVSLILSFGSEQVIKIMMAQNESNAQVTLKLISTALENYADDNQGIFPRQFSLLTKTSPPYLDKDYIALFSLKGYNYRCPRLESSGYRCLATPLKCKLSGKTIYTVTTGGIFTSEECVKKE